MIEAYPLCWPSGKPRTPSSLQKRSNFHKQQMGEFYRSKKQLSVFESTNKVLEELDRFTKVGKTIRIPKESIVISTNIRTNKNNLPYSDRSEPKDCGVAVYFTLDNKSYCLPCDKWDRVADNLAAIAAHLQALRGIERWGVGETHDVFTGFRALPESTTTRKRDWMDVLDITSNPTMENATKSYKKKVVELHPDKGGTHEEFVELQNAYETAEKILQN